MRKMVMILVVAALAITAGPSFAELQNVTVGGSIQIRGNWLDSASVPDTAFGRNELFEPFWTRSLRGIFDVDGNQVVNGFRGLRWFGQPGRFPVTSPLSLSDNGHSFANYEQRTRLNVRGDFTDNVSAFIEFDVYNVWSEDFRSNYITGVDARGGSDVELYQSYIEANEMFGAPLRLRIGRQELAFGSGFLVGANSSSPYFAGLSFDAIRATYKTDMFSVDAFAAKLNERSPIEQDGDVDFYGVYGSYTGVENMSFDAYWMMVRDARSVEDIERGLLGEWIEDVVGVDDYDVTTLHTVGLRGAGTVDALSFEAEVAYQFGNADIVSWNFFAPATFPVSPYGDDGADFGEWGANLEVSYAFDMAWTPELFAGAAYFGGEDNRDLDFTEWLAAMFCPFYAQDASLSFNRLFSDKVYSYFLDSNRNLSNVWLANFGVSANPTECVKLTLMGTYFQTLEAYDVTWPVLPTFGIFGSRTWTPLSGFSFIDQENDDDLGWELVAKANYAYSEDLSFEVGYSHFFTGNGLEEGSFNLQNGLAFDGGKDNEDMDYFWFETKLAF